MYAIGVGHTVREQSTSLSFDHAQFSLATLLSNMTYYNSVLYFVIAGLNLIGGFARVRKVSEPLQPFFYLKTWDMLAD